MTYEFGSFLIDEGERVLRRHGQLVPLTPKVFDILPVLVQNSGSVLTKNEMMNLVWPDTTVGRIESRTQRLNPAISYAMGPTNMGTSRPSPGEAIVSSPRFVSLAMKGSRSILSQSFFSLNENADSATEYLADGITESLISKSFRAWLT